MSTKKKKSRSSGAQPRSGKAERYIQPSLLLELKIKPSYGYEKASMNLALCRARPRRE